MNEATHHSPTHHGANVPTSALSTPVERDNAPATTQPSQQALRVLVLGGTGFIGRHVVAALLHQGITVIIGSRDPKQHQLRQAPTGASPCAPAQFRALRLERLLQPAAWDTLIADVNLVINCVGILRQRPNESYAQVHHLAPAALAAACAHQGIAFIHTSALGLHEGAKSRFLASKLRGEHAIAASGADYAIVRPSLLDGTGGYGARWLRAVSRSPLQIVPRGARGKIAAMCVSELGEAYAALARLPSLAQHRVVELGGLHHYSYGEYLRMLRTGYSSGAALQIPLPNWMTRVGAHLCDLLHFSPFSYGHWILLQRDNIPNPNRLPELLGRAPSPINTTSALISPIAAQR